jgi:hypothetical protein
VTVKEQISVAVIVVVTGVVYEYVYQCQQEEKCNCRILFFGEERDAFLTILLTALFSPFALFQPTNFLWRILAVSSISEVRSVMILFSESSPDSHGKE